MKTRIFAFLVAILLLNVTVSAQNVKPLKGDVNGDGQVNVSDVITTLDLILSGNTYGYFYLGTTQPTADNYQSLLDVVSSYTSIDEALGTTVTIDAGETLYMLCPAGWMDDIRVKAEDESGNSIFFLDEKDELAVSGYAIYSTDVLTERKTVVLKSLDNIIRVKTPGSLNTYFTADQYSTITELRIVGNINYSDIGFLHNFTNLELLDMSKANIVEAGSENKLPNGFSWIRDDDDYYHYLTNLKTLYLPQSLETINYNDFAGLESLEYIKIYDHVTGTLTSRFQENMKLKEIEVTSGNVSFASYDGCLYSKDYTTLIQCPAAKTSIDFPSGVTSIGYGAFYYTSLQSVTVPEGVETLGNYAFYHRYSYRVGNLTSIFLPSTLRTIGYSCFGFQNIKSINIPEGVETIPTECFYGCFYMTSITLPSTISSYGTGAFMDTGLTSIIIPEGPTIIPDEFFQGCRYLKEITFPSTAIRIGDLALRGCHSLETIHCQSYLMNGRYYDNAVGIKNGCNVYVPNAYLTSYQNDGFWKASVFNIIGE